MKRGPRAGGVRTTVRRYVTYDAAGARGRNWHYHELNPVLNRKRLMGGLERCVDAPESAECASFLDFAAPRAAAMPGAPAVLAVQTRSWDFRADLDKPGFCDTMATLELDVATRVVRKRDGLPCDALDLRACCAATLGTI